MATICSRCGTRNETTQDTISHTCLNRTERMLVAKIMELEDQVRELQQLAKACGWSITLDKSAT